jgi:hypothetical protein
MPITRSSVSNPSYHFLNLFFQIMYSDELRNTNIFIIFLFCKLIENGNLTAYNPNLNLLYFSKLVNFILCMYIIMTFHLRWLFVASLICGEISDSIDTYELRKILRSN